MHQNRKHLCQSLCIAGHSVFPWQCSVLEGAVGCTDKMRLSDPVRVSPPRGQLLSLRCAVRCSITTNNPVVKPSPASEPGPHPSPGPGTLRPLSQDRNPVRHSAPNRVAVYPSLCVQRLAGRTCDCARGTMRFIMDACKGNGSVQLLF